MTLTMSDSEENGKLVESIYKNILDKFEPGARQLITSGKAYLKALQAASTAAEQYMVAVSRLARQAQQGTWDATGDIGSTLLQFADVYKEIQTQHLHILKAFYVDVLAPLETNLEKDTKVIQAEQKKFQQQFRQRQDNYQKAVGIVKKQKKKTTRTSRSSSNLEKELKNMHSLEDEKLKLDGFCNQSLRSALTQERIRYGFVLERQCSLAKHFLAFHSKGQSLLQQHMDDWTEVSKSRDSLPEHIQVMFSRNISQPMMGNGLYGVQHLDNGGRNNHLDREDSSSNTLRKARSMDASSMDLDSLSEAIDRDPPYRIPMTPATITRAKSDFNLSSSHQSLATEDMRTRSNVAPDDNRRRRTVAKALYSYLSSGEHQLSFHEGDVIGIIGERNKGWQYGENLRTRRSGWFPVAYTEYILEHDEDDHTPTSSPRRHRASIAITNFATPTFDPFSLNYPHCRTLTSSTSWTSPPISAMNSKANWASASSSSETGSISPPPPPPPMPPRAIPSDSRGYGRPSARPYTPELQMRMPRSLTSPAPLRMPAAAASLHSSNDSGFCNDSSNAVPIAPEADYIIDEEPPMNKDNVFATVKLRRTQTNDRSAPKIA